MKIQYFLELDHNDMSLLGLWGAGKKGKKIARQLIEKNVEFVWFCNQQSKIGHNIYGKILQSAVDVQKRECEQMIVAVANPADQREIIKDLSRSKYELGSSAWFFC